MRGNGDTVTFPTSGVLFSAGWTMNTLTDRVLLKISDHAPEVFLGSILLLAFWGAGWLAQIIIIKISSHRNKSGRSVGQLMGRTANTALIIVGCVTALGTIGINISALVAGLGLTGFALGFALRDALSNLLAGILVLIYRPFNIDDMINVAGFEGTVTEIDLRYTTLAQDNKLYLIPNSILFTNAITLIRKNSDVPSENQKPVV